MIEIALLLLIAFWGGLIAWFLATARARAGQAAQRQELEARLAAQQGSLEEIRKQLRDSREEIERLQANLRALAAEKAAADAQANGVRESPEEQKGALNKPKIKWPTPSRRLRPRP